MTTQVIKAIKNFINHGNSEGHRFYVN